MGPNDVPSPEVIAATDAVFEDQPVTPVLPPAGQGEEAELPKAEPEPAPEPGPAVPASPLKDHPSPLKDYVRELQQEFEEQEAEGKLPPPGGGTL